MTEDEVTIEERPPRPISFSWIAIGVVLLMGFFGIALMFVAPLQSDATAVEFHGITQEKEGNKLLVSGHYDALDDPGSFSGESILARVRVTPETIYTKVKLYRPTEEDLTELGGFFSYDDLAREVVQGSLDDIHPQQFGLTVRATENIYGKSVFTAREIRYVEIQRERRPMQRQSAK